MALCLPHTTACQARCSADGLGTLKVIDFGLSKRYLDEQGSVIPRREGRTGFRGSTAYASVYAHEEVEQGIALAAFFKSHICAPTSGCASVALLMTPLGMCLLRHFHPSRHGQLSSSCPDIPIPVSTMHICATLVSLSEYSFARTSTS